LTSGVLLLGLGACDKKNDSGGGGGGETTAENHPKKTRTRLATTINAEIIRLNWSVGKRIKEDVLYNKQADYGKQVVKNLALRLTEKACSAEIFCIYLWKNSNAMVIEIDKTVTPTRLKQMLKSMKAARSKASRLSLSEFFGALPHIGDGLELQKKVRNEWG
jgi:hypothetical protein